MMWLALLLALLFTPAHAAEWCVASVYGTHDSDQNGTTTASGIPLDDSKPTIAHKSLPLRSYAKVTNTRTGQWGVFRVTDRGPFVKGRCADLSHVAAKQVGCNGLCSVTVEAQ